MFVVHRRKSIILDLLDVSKLDTMSILLISYYKIYMISRRVKDQEQYVFQSGNPKSLALIRGQLRSIDIGTAICNTVLLLSNKLFRTCSNWLSESCATLGGILVCGAAKCRELLRHQNYPNI